MNEELVVAASAKDVKLELTPTTSPEQQQQQQKHSPHSNGAASTNGAPSTNGATSPRTSGADNGAKSVSPSSPQEELTSGEKIEKKDGEKGIEKGCCQKCAVM